MPAIQVFSSVSSTNDILLERNCFYPNGHTCFAERQTKSRGMKNKNWVTPKNGICFSVSWTINRNIKIAYSINQIIAIKITQSLSENNFQNIRIKWPNDLLFNNKKIGGILVETKYNPNRGLYMVIGVGLNIRLSDEERENIDQPSTDLFEINEDECDRNKIASIILDSVISSFELFEKRKYDS